VYSFDYTLGNSQGSVRSFVSRFGTLESDYAWFIFEKISDRVLAETPNFGNFLDREMRLKGSILAANLSPDRGKIFTTLSSALRRGPPVVQKILAPVVAENRLHSSYTTYVAGCPDRDFQTVLTVPKKVIENARFQNFREIFQNISGAWPRQA
jgi:hypothetical protein